MDETQPLDIFLQPSRRLLVLSVLFIAICVLLLVTTPVAYLYKLLMFFLMLLFIIHGLRTKVFLSSSNSIIRIGCDGGVAGSDGEVTEPRWWYQRRFGDKVYAPLSNKSRVWVEWVNLDFSCKPWQLDRAVLIARDSVESGHDFQRLKRILRSY